MERRTVWALILICTVAVVFSCGLAYLVLPQRDLSLHQNEKRTIFGAVYMTMNNPFYQIIDTEMRSAIEAHGDTLISRNPSLHDDRQQEEIRELVELGAKVIFVNPVDINTVAPALEEARQHGVKIIAIDTNLPDDDLADCTIVSDNFLAGQQCAWHLLQQRSSGHIALLTHNQAKSAVDRIEGFLSVVKDAPGFHVVAKEDCLGQLERAMPAMENMLAQHPDIDVVMALNDPTAMGALAALQHAGRLKGTLLYGVDGSSDVKNMIAHSMITATAGQQPRRIGTIAVDRAYKLLAGQDPAKKNIALPTVLLTRDNLSQYNDIGY